MERNKPINSISRIFMLLVLAMVVLAVFCINGPAGKAVAADKTPGRVVISSAEVNGNRVTVSWSKVKYAGKYKVYVQTGGAKGWKLLKTVKKTAANKAKYSGKINYKIVLKGGKYKVYKRVNPFRFLKGTTALKLRFKGKYDTTYRFSVRAVKGTKKGRFSKIRKAVTGPEPAPDEGEQGDQGEEPADPAPVEPTDPTEPEPEPVPDLIELITPELLETADNYVRKTYSDNIMEDYTKGGFTWQVNDRTISWLYYNGLVLESLLMYDFDSHFDEVKKFYDQHINDEGEIIKFSGGELDSYMPMVSLINILRSGRLTEEEAAKYNKAINFAYNQLENQVVYPEAGNLLLHSQYADGTPRKHWKDWNICLDGIYMSQLFLVRLTEAIDDGQAEITAQDGHIVTSQELWDDIYSRLCFAIENMKDPETGLLFHGYSVGMKKTNKVTWSRGLGWFTMVLVEAAEKMPDQERAAVLRDHFSELMEAIVKWQDPATGLWYNVTIMREEITDNRPETSGTAMFAYSLLRGSDSGLLTDKALRNAGITAFKALTENEITEEGLLDVYRSSSVTPEPDKYQINGFCTNDGKGVGPYIMTAAYAKKLKAQN